ncbi:ERAD-associated protein [Knufia obscura]|uniref:ERAD-associated protein n=2 Tax=Knufia TaxID=430999 RepID=A0AAN8ERP2_9EURO|nr:ERAD-associated protein [Knufia obscura]KAK5950788.1 ERAD-associated protein [Knufia fluminis]
MSRAFQHSVFGLFGAQPQVLQLTRFYMLTQVALLLIWLIAGPSIAYGAVTTGNAGPKSDDPGAQAQAQAQYALHKDNPSQDSSGHLTSRTHQIWSELRENEPTWKEAVIDARPAGLPATAWHYFKVVFRALFMNAPAHTSSDEHGKLSAKLQKAVNGLSEVAPVDDDALFLLAEMNFYGNFSHPRRPEKALEFYSELADRDGNATAQHMVGLLYATGLGGALEIDQARAQLFYTFAAEQGEVKAEMTLAHRYHMGIGTAKSCEKAVQYYKRVADKSMDWWLSGPPGGRLLQRNAYRWADEVGGAYGEAASWTSSGPFAPDKNAIYSSLDNMLEYLDMRERQGDFGASLTLGKHFYEPPRGYRRNLKKARSQFMKVATQYWTRDGKTIPKAPKNIEKTAAKAAAYIGRMFLRGEGTEQNYEKAAIWFKRGVASGDAFAQYHLGLMYRDGMGLPRDGNRAATYLKAASEQQLGIAQSALGVLFLDQGDLDTASRYFELAKNAGIVEAIYYLAEFTNQGLGRQRNCHHAATYYKIVAEKAESLHSAFIEANSAFGRDDYERAFVASLMAAEQGSEPAQANVAFLLDQKSSVVSLPMVPIFSNPLESVPSSQRTKLLDNPELAQVYYTRSAHQQNIDSLIKAGDYHAAGIGTPTRTLPVKSNKTTPSIEAMYSCYSMAAEHPNAAQALWNMGWMHEIGVGSVEQDFHMAKRYYDLALEMNKEAYLPVKLALLRLRTRSWWNGVSGGKVKPMEGEDDVEAKKGPKSIKEWFSRFIDSALEMEAQDYVERQQQGDYGDDLEYIANGEPGMPGGDNEYWYTGAQRQEGDDLYEDFDDGLLESLIIIALAGALAMLVYVRAQRQRDARARDGQGQGPAPGNGNLGPVGANGLQPVLVQPQQGVGQQQAPGQNGGFFPNPGDPEYQEWVAGGVGH